MNLSTFWVLDFGDDLVTTLAAQTGPQGTLKLLGVGEAPAEGMRQGAFVSLSDVSECVLASVRHCEKSAGISCSVIHYNLDDPCLQILESGGFRTLAGEGQIRQVDVQKALEMALRLVGQFEKSVVYCKEISYLIDGRDMVTNPVGVFGRQLDVTLQVILAQAQHLENWRNAFLRVGLKCGSPVLSILASARGVLDEPQRMETKIVWDLGRDVLNGALFDRGTIRGCEVGAESSMGAGELSQWVHSANQRLLKRMPHVQEVVLTGDLAEKSPIVSQLKEALGPTVRVAAPLGLAALNLPHHASQAGLLHLASEKIPGGIFTKSPERWSSDLRKKVASLVNEYF